MSKGIVFIWMPACFMSQVVDIMFSKQFIYVENLEIGLFDRQKILEYFRSKGGNNDVETEAEKNQKK